MQDTAYSQCETQLKIDFFNILSKQKAFESHFNAKKYIEDNKETFFVDPEEWLNEFHGTIDAFIKICIMESHKILMNKKYLFFLVLDKDRFYSLYKTIYDKTFANLDIYLSNEQVTVNNFVAIKMQEYEKDEVH